MKYLIAAVCLLVGSSVSYADSLVELRQLNIEYKDFTEGGYYPLISSNGLPYRELGREVNVNINTNILRYGFWDNTIHSMTDEIINSGGKGQFRLVGWKFKLGIHLTSYLDVQYEHFSQHLLDTKYFTGRFPVQDSFGFTLYLYDLNRAESIF